MVGCVGNDPTTPAMSMQYSSFELTAPFNFFYIITLKINLKKYLILNLMHKKLTN